MSESTYKIVDEPAPSAASHLAVNPFWIFLGGVLGGMWLAWPWYVFNGQAIGSATRWRELALVIGALVGTIALSVSMLVLQHQGVLDAGNIKYAFVGLTAFKVVFLYLLHITQARAFELHEHFGGRTRSGIVGIVAGLLLRGVVLSAFNNDLWFLVVS